METSLSQIDSEVESFLQELMEESYLNGAGLKETLDIEPIYAKYASLFTANTLDLIKDQITPGDTASELFFIYSFLVDGYLGNLIKGIDEEIANSESKATVRWDGKDIPYRNVPVAIGNEQDTSRRHELDKLRRELNVQFHALYEKRWIELHQTVHQLNGKNYTSFYNEIRNLHLDKFKTVISNFLKDTESRYRTWLEYFLNQKSISLSEAQKCDISAIFRAQEYDSAFPVDGLLPALENTLAGLGLNSSANGSIKLDLESRPLKSSRAFCAPVTIPGDIKLVIMPHGGQDDYQSLLHESGHAQHFAHVDPALPAAYKYLGDNSVTESFAFLFHYLTTDPAWLKIHARFESPEKLDSYLKLAFFNRLYMLRRYGAKLLYELELHNSNDSILREHLYTDILQDALLVKYPEEDALLDLDDGFYSAQYLRAWIFEMQLRTYLRSEFGQLWFESAEAGNFLKTIWQLGQKEDILQLVRRINADDLDILPLQLEIEKYLSS